MSLLENDLADKIERIANSQHAFEQLMLSCIMPGTVKCIIAASKRNCLLEKLKYIYRIKMHKPMLASYIKEAIDQASFCLKSHQGRRIVQLDCSDLRKGDALGWIRAISKEDNNAIIVIDNVTRIPEGDVALYDPKQFVENILVRSWKNNDIHIGDYHINRCNLTVILTSPPEDEEKLRLICSAYSYAWVGDIEKKIENLMSKKEGIVLN